MFYNLIDNTVRHGGNATIIHFSIEEQNGAHIIICEDNGVGISDDIRKKLFISCLGSDHGLGLFLSREILSIAGIIIAEKGELGHGARFVMTVPMDGTRRM